ncbi:DUF3408 domain-containing protein [uncultured Duncaniella sp.]|uniref:DUF3408 domain-containing protein n=1 Tax=uncultured Duncaniella sp. TaxID=2768039 RepID=UPI00272B47E1|nr:DUF3408 domain-containing protein [uncultured Duncaniella sp.]
MAANEKEINEQGEQFLHALRPKPTLPASAPKTEKEPEKKRSASQAPASSDGDAERYMNTFIRNKSLNFRKGPGQALIHKDIHTILNRIVNIIGDNEISVSQYVNNVLAQHLEQYSELITKLLTEKFKAEI